MSKNVGQRAFHSARSKKELKAEVAQLFERAVTPTATPAATTPPSPLAMSVDLGSATPRTAIR